MQKGSLCKRNQFIPSAKGDTVKQSEKKKKILVKSIDSFYIQRGSSLFCVRTIFPCNGTDDFCNPQLPGLKSEKPFTCLQLYCQQITLLKST